MSTPPIGVIVKIEARSHNITRLGHPDERVREVAIIVFANRTSIVKPLEAFPNPESVSEGMIFCWKDRFGGEFEVFTPGYAPVTTMATAQPQDKPAPSPTAT